MYISIVIRRFRRFSLKVTEIIRRDAATSRQNVRTNTDEQNTFDTAERMILPLSLSLSDHITNVSTSLLTYVTINTRKEIV